MSNPLVSALCVSHASRFGMLQRAILNFSKQKYAERELIILVGQNGYLDMINSFLADPRLDLGDARNKITVIHAPFRNSAEGAQHGVMRANGDIIVAWDDDNLSHPDRLAFQVERTTNTPTLLSESMYYFYDSDELFVTNYAQPTGTPMERCAAASLMLRRKDWPLNLQQGERRPWAVAVLAALAQRHHYQFISGHPQYFIAGSNGDNWRPPGLHRRLASELPLSWTRAKLLDRQAEVAEWVQGYELPLHEIDVCGKDAQAFKVDSVSTTPDWFAPTDPPEDWHTRIPNQEHQQLVNQERADQRRQQQRNAAAAQQAAAQQPQGTSAAEHPESE